VATGGQKLGEVTDEGHVVGYVDAEGADPLGQVGPERAQARGQPGRHRGVELAGRRQHHLDAGSDRSGARRRILVVLGDRRRRRGLLLLTHRAPGGQQHQHGADERTPTKGTPVRITSSPHPSPVVRSRPQAGGGHA
jgi:hypothetical protein